MTGVGARPFLPSLPVPCASGARSQTALPPPAPPAAAGEEPPPRPEQQRQQQPGPPRGEGRREGGAAARARLERGARRGRGGHLPLPPAGRGGTMADDDVLFEDVYELCEVIGK